VIVGLALLAAYVGWLAYASLIAPPTHPMSQKEKTTSAWIKKLAQQSGGDPNKLSPEDRDKLQRMTMGHGEQAMKMEMER